MSTGVCAVVREVLTVVMGYPIFEDPSRSHTLSRGTHDQGKRDLDVLLFITATSHGMQVRKEQEKMSTHQQMLSDAIGKEPAMASENYSTVCNTRTVIKWHLQKTPVERKGTKQTSTLLAGDKLTDGIAEAERNAALAAEEAAALRAGFEVTPAELQQSQTEWKEWLSQRSSSADFVSGWRDSVPRSVSQQQEVGLVSEARFGTVVVALHDKCILCEAMETIRADSIISYEEKVQRLRRLEHTVPRLQMSTLTGVSPVFEARSEPTFDDFVGAPTWTSGSASLLKDRAAVPRKGLFDGVLFREEKLEGTIDVQEGHWKMSRALTKALVNSVGSDKEILDEVSYQEPFEEHSKAVRQRVNLYKRNKDAARSALNTAQRKDRLDHNDMEKAAKAKADAEELERDITFLQSTLNATKARLEQIRNGNGRSVLTFNKEFCEMRRYKREAGIDVEEEGIASRDPVPLAAPDKENTPFRAIQLMRQEYQERRSLRGSPPPPAEGKAASVDPPTHSAPVDSPEK